ncbi:MAG: glycosyltransferase [Thermoproteales archaeon]|nr:glycosyltransferase [Thermoproteales archaeon]
MSERHTVSVIIPAKNGGQLLYNLVYTLLKKQTLTPSEVIIVYDGVLDEYIEKILEMGGKVIFSGERKGANRARNIGVEEAKGQILVFTDEDCIPSSTWIEKIVEEMNQLNVEAVAGSTFMANPQFFFSRYLDESVLTSSPKYSKRIILKNDYPPGVVIATCNFAVRRDAWKRVKGFDEEYKWYGSDDMDLGFKLLKAGYRIACSPKPIVYHFHRTALTKILKRYFQYGQGFAIYSKKHPESSFTRISRAGLLATFTWITSAIIMVLGGLIYPPLAVAGALMFALPYLGLLAFYFKKKKTKSLKATIIYPLLDQILAFSSSLGYLHQNLSMKLKTNNKT